MDTWRFGAHRPHYLKQHISNTSMPLAEPTLKLNSHVESNRTVILSFDLNLNVEPLIQSDMWIANSTSGGSLSRALNSAFLPMAAVHRTSELYSDQLRLPMRPDFHHSAHSSTQTRSAQRTQRRTSNHDRKIKVKIIGRWRWSYCDSRATWSTASESSMRHFGRRRHWLQRLIREDVLVTQLGEEDSKVLEFGWPHWIRSTTSHLFWGGMPSIYALI